MHSRSGIVLRGALNPGSAYGSATSGDLMAQALPCVEMDAFGPTDDPVADLLIAGRAETIEEAEEILLDENLDTLLELVDSALSDEEFRRHPLVQLLLSRGSRGWEDSTT